MKNLILEYIKIVAYTVSGLIFGLAFFLLFVNFYHYKEVNNSYVKRDSDFEVIGEINDTIFSINKNISSFEMNSYNGREDIYSMASVKSRLQLCTKQLNNSEILDILSKGEIDISDVYKFQQLFQNYVVNECLVKQLYDLTITDGEQSAIITSLAEFSPFFKDSIEQFLDSTSYIQNFIKNNSSYSFSSNSTKLNVFDSTKDSYYYVVGNYRKALDFVLDVSSWYDKVSRGEL